MMSVDTRFRSTSAVTVVPERFWSAGHRGILVTRAAIVEKVVEKALEHDLVKSGSARC
jgi:hypothetical protein